MSDRTCPNCGMTSDAGWIVAVVNHVQELGDYKQGIEATCGCSYCLATWEEYDVVDTSEALFDDWWEDMDGGG